MENELVSIITPVYNAQDTIAGTIESVQAQTCGNWEMILADDCSTDNSMEIMQSYAKKDSRIRLLVQKTNQGVAQARNAAIASAKGRFVAFLDSDDLWCPDKLEKQLAFMKQKQAAFCYTACDVIDEYGKQMGKVRFVPETADYNTLLKGNYIPCLTVVIDRKTIDIPSMPSIPHEDYAVWLEILKAGHSAWGLNEVLARYRVNQHSVSSNKLKAAGWTWNIYRKNQKLSLIKSSYCFMSYLVRAVIKRI